MGHTLGCSHCVESVGFKVLGPFVHHVAMAALKHLLNKYQFRMGFGR